MGVSNYFPEGQIMNFMIAHVSFAVVEYSHDNYPSHVI
jgi:hypothetical protein